MLQDFKIKNGGPRNCLGLMLGDLTNDNSAYTAHVDELGKEAFEVIFKRMRAKHMFEDPQETIDLLSQWKVLTRDKIDYYDQSGKLAQVMETGDKNLCNFLFPILMQGLSPKLGFKTFLKNHRDYVSDLKEVVERLK